MSDSFAAWARQTFPTQAGLEAFAASFARTLRPGDVVALSGELGSGKTTFVRAAVRARHGEDQTTSPTFTFWHRYAGDPPIDHLDLYRIEIPPTYMSWASRTRSTAIRLRSSSGGPMRRR